MLDTLNVSTVAVLDFSGGIVGTGFVITRDLVVTCAHVVGALGVDPEDHVVLKSQGGVLEAEVLSDGWHPELDVAFLRLLEPLSEKCVPLSLIESEALECVSVRSFGYPFVGDVEGLWGVGEFIGEVARSGQRVLQIDSTEITEGFSGAPVIELRSGSVVGMVTAITVPDKLARLDSVAFAIPAETLRDLSPVPLVLNSFTPVDLPPLSQYPRSTRFQLDNSLVARDEELAWLRELEGDGLVVGQPGSGKTFLLHKFALEGGGLFVVGDDREDITAFLSTHRPDVVIVDDAQVRAELLTHLRYIRSALGYSYRIVATCWLGDEEALKSALVLPESAVCRLGLLTRDEIVEVINAIGLVGPNGLVREIVNQAEGRPGLAATLTYLSLKGDVRQIVVGDALRTALFETLDAGMGQPTREILASFALGGDPGMTLEVVADRLSLSPIQVHQSVVELAAGGIILEVDPLRLSVRPPALRHVLIRDVFFCGAAALPISVFHGLVEEAPSLAESAKTLIGAKARGAIIPSSLLKNLVEIVNASDVWRLYVQLGREEVAWTFEHHPEMLTSIASLGLKFAPDAAIPLLLTDAIGDERQLHAHPGHPIRIIQDWVLAGEPGTDQPIERRRALLRSVRSWLQNAHDQTPGLSALRFVLSPNFESHLSDPGAGNTLTIRRGHLPVDDIRAVEGFWPSILKILHDFPISDWTPIRMMVEDWVYPGRYNMHVSFEASEVIEAFALQLLRDLIPLIESHPGLCRWARQISGHLNPDFQIPFDQVFEILYPVKDIRDVDRWEAAGSRQKHAVLDLAHRWRRRDPHKVIQDLQCMEGEARLVEVTWPRWTGLLCRELAEDISQPELWVRLMLETDLANDCIAPFLHQTITRNIPGWIDLFATSLQHPVFHPVAVSLILTYPDPPHDLLSQALTMLENLEERVKVHCIRSEISTPVLKRLLRHPDKQIVIAAVVGEWNADPKRDVRETVVEEWQEAVVTDVTEDYWLGEILEKRPSLAYPWLEARLQERFPFCFTRNWGQAVLAAVSVLDVEERCRLLRQLPEDDPTGEMVSYLVGDEPEVYRALLDHEQYRGMHLIPLSRPPEGGWTDLAKLALAAGYSSYDIVRATCWPIGVRVEMGPESKRWKATAQRFERLCEHEDAEIREIGCVGAQQAQAMYQKALERERREAIYGR